MLEIHVVPYLESEATPFPADTAHPFRLIPRLLWTRDIQRMGLREEDQGEVPPTGRAALRNRQRAAWPQHWAHSSPWFPDHTLSLPRWPGGVSVFPKNMTRDQPLSRKRGSKSQNT